MNPALPYDGIHFEDVKVGDIILVDGYTLTRDEVIDFAKAWDPMPIHIDEQAAERGPFGGLTASGLHILGIRHRLVHRLPLSTSVIASAGFDEVRFLRPVRPGDTLRLELAWLEKRRSTSKPDRGVVVVGFRLLNQSAQLVMTHRDTIMMKLRQPD